MIARGCDHAATDYKKKIESHLNGRGIAFEDFGAGESDCCDYPEYAEKVADAVKSGRCEKGILICGTGIGMCIAANKVRGIRCALCHDVFSAKACRLHNDANVLALGQRTMGIENVLEIVDAFLDTSFSEEERHVRRLGGIADIERRNS